VGQKSALNPGSKPGELSGGVRKSKTVALRFQQIASMMSTEQELAWHIELDDPNPRCPGAVGL